MSRMLAIDYGLKRVGIAVTDISKIIARPLVTVSPEEIMTFLHEYFISEDVDTVILGYAADVSKDADIVKATEKLFVKLKNIFCDKHIELYDERYTSKIAYHMLINGGFKKKDRNQKKNIDMMSACILLQSYMDMLNIRKSTP